MDCDGGTAVLTATILRRYTKSHNSCLCVARTFSCHFWRNAATRRSCNNPVGKDLLRGADATKGGTRREVKSRMRELDSEAGTGSSIALLSSHGQGEDDRLQSAYTTTGTPYNLVKSHSDQNLGACCPILWEKVVEFPLIIDSLGQLVYCCRRALR